MKNMNPQQGLDAAEMQVKQLNEKRLV